MTSAAYPVTMHLTNAYHERSGGIRTFYHAAMEAANRAGRPFRLVVPAARTSVEDVGAFARIYRIAAPAAPVIDSRYHLLLPHTYLSPWSTTLRRLLVTEQPALVEITDKYTLPWLAGLLRKGWIRSVRRPVLVGLSCERMDDNVAAYLTSSAAGRRLARLYMGRLYLPMFDFHIAASDYVADELRAVAPAHRQAHIAVRTFGVDFGRFRPERRSAALRQDVLGNVDARQRTQLLLYAGRLAPEKNTALLLEMMEHLAGERDQAYYLALVGSGPLREWLQAEATARVPGRIRFLPHVTDGQALADLYASCDGFVHPNPREPFGIAPLEAMASGCPLVVPRAGGVLTYANDQNAWLAEPTGAGFAHAVRALVEDPAERARRVACARATAEYYDWPAVTARMFGHYDELRRGSTETAESVDELKEQLQKS